MRVSEGRGKQLFGSCTAGIGRYDGKDFAGITVDSSKLEDLLFDETTTLGLRRHEVRRSVLGRRTGNEPSRPKTFVHGRTQQDDDDNVVSLPDRQRADAPDEEVDRALGTAADGVREIRTMDPNFRPDEFTSGARTAWA